MTRPRSKRSLHPVEKADLKAADAVAVNHGAKARWLDRFAELGDQPPLIALSGLFFVAGLIRRDRKLARTGLRMLAAHAVSNAVKGFVKDEIDRTRPGVALKKERYELKKGRSRDGKMRSMPSGHSAGLTAVARAVGREYPVLGAAAGAAAVSVMAAQLPAGNHFISDIGAGAAIGLASEEAVALLMGPPVEVN